MPTSSVRIAIQWSFRMYLRIVFTPFRTSTFWNIDGVIGQVCRAWVVVGIVLNTTLLETAVQRLFQSRQQYCSRLWDWLDSAFQSVRDSNDSFSRASHRSSDRWLFSSWIAPAASQEARCPRWSQHGRAGTRQVQNVMECVKWWNVLLAWETLQAIPASKPASRR